MTFGRFVRPAVSSGPAALTLTSASPATGRFDTSTVVTLTGTGFTDVDHADANLHDCLFEVISDTSIELTLDGIELGAIAGDAPTITLTRSTDSATVSRDDLFTFTDGAIRAFDFSSLALGHMSNAAFVAATGLQFARTTGSTVQTSASTIHAGASADEPVIGNNTSDDSRRGLVIQPCTFNQVSASADNSPRDLNVAWAAGSSATVTSAYAAGPDGVTPGVGCTRAQISSGGYSPYASLGPLGVPAAACFSSWQRSKDAAVNGDMQMIFVTATPSDGKTKTRAPSNTWGRMELLWAGSSYGAGAVSDSRDYSGAVGGGQSARARDVLVDYIQFEWGDYSTEAIPTGHSLRACDRVWDDDGATLVASNGQVKFEGSFIPKCASTQTIYRNSTAASATAAAWFLFSWGGGGDSYAKIKTSDRKLYVKVEGGTEYVSTNAISFSREDVVDVVVNVGNGVASVAKYRVNAGSWVDLVLATVPDVPAPSGDVAYFFDDHASITGDSGQLPMWCRKVGFYEVSS